MADLDQESLVLHEQKKGKLTVRPTVRLQNAHDLAVAYTPGVAAPCLKIAADPEAVYTYTGKGHMVAIVTDGTAVLGLGDIGPKAALPVMEGKAALLKKFGGVDAIPICLATKDPEEIIATVERIAPAFGAIMMEDISAPRCVTIERALQRRLDIPVFHDDQHGTAIVVAAAVINVCRLTQKTFPNLSVVVSGTGAAGSSICRMLRQLGVGTIHAFNKQGIVTGKKYSSYDFLIQELLDQKIIDAFDSYQNDSIGELLTGADVFVGVSAPNLVDQSMVKSMAPDAAVFALANPRPEILPEDAKAAGAKIIGTGRSDYPNQINNVLVFPGLFQGALRARARQITEDMKVAAACALAGLVSDEELRDDYILPGAFDKRVAKAIASAVEKQVPKKRR